MPTDDHDESPVPELHDAGSGTTDGPVDAGEGLTDLLGGLMGASGEGGFDMGSLLQSAMDMQQQLLDAQQQAAAAVVTGSAGGGAVEIEVTGGMEFLAVRIAPEAVDPDDVELLADLVLAALHDAVRAVGEMQQASMGGMPGLSGLSGMPGLSGLSGMPGLDALGGLGLGDPGLDDEDWEDDELDEDLDGGDDV